MLATPQTLIFCSYHVHSILINCLPTEVLTVMKTHKKLAKLIMSKFKCVSDFSTLNGIRNYFYVNEKLIVICH